MKPVDSFKNRLETALKIRNMKPVELHEKTGISESLLSKYLSGNATARQRKISLIADALNINPVWLMGYDISMDKDIQINEISNSVVTIPILKTIKNTYSNYYMSKENWDGTIVVDKKLAENGTIYALRVPDDSMSPMLVKDDIIIVKNQNNFENGNIVVALINNNELTIKKAYKDSEGIELKAINPYYPPRTFNNNSIEAIPIEIIGIVKQLRRDFKDGKE